MEDFSFSQNNIFQLLKQHRTRICLILAVLFFVLVYMFLFSSPRRESLPVKVKIEQKFSLRDVSLVLKEEGVIRSRAIFEVFVILFGGEKNIKPAYYLFEYSMPVYKIARIIAKGEHGIPLVVATIPEGFSFLKIADVFSEKLADFNKENFFILAKNKEGYLFPDTYFFSNVDTEEDVVRTMTANFYKKISPLRGEIERLNKTEHEVITMASLIEGEAKGDSDRDYISGILWKRLSINMPLQVDVAPETYKKRGLPEGPINNPGLASILAAIRPKTSPYLYYLHGSDGKIYFAKNFEEHKKNKTKYLSR